ncbi:MAG TPA: O-antigen ligase family protein, partial [Solirubrobacteraceae bacterium]|nr:O-antigen ligase family protein [Solirubrobacteraceae bacterium]
AILTLPILAVGAISALRMAGRGVVCGIALIAIYTLGVMFFDGPSIFLAGRLNGPVEYRNATALLFCIAYWPLIVTAASRDRGRVLRAVCLGLAELMLGLAFLTQSRGVLFGLGCGALVVLILGPEKTRRAWLALLSLILLAGASSRLLVPYHAFIDGKHVSSGDIANAASALAVLACAAIALGFLVAVFDAGLRPVSPAMARIRVGARLGLLAVLLMGLAGGMVAVRGEPIHELQVKWRQFKSLQTTSTSATRYTSTGGQRYDLWRVALDELQAHPIAGVGAGSYQFDYYRLRRSTRNLEDPHGLLFQIGAELGIVGLLLFAMIPIGIIGSLRRWWRVAPRDVRRSAGGLAAAGATFIGQSLVDWMWRIPGLTALGLLCLAVAATLLARTGLVAGAVEPTRPTGHPDGNALSDRLPSLAGLAGRWARRPLATRLAAAVILFGAVALTLSLYLSNVYILHARDEIGLSPTAQLADARIASSFDPWSTDPHYIEASALESMGMRAQARAQLEDARRLESTNAVPLGLLGDFEARGGDFAKARGYYRQALVLDPLDVGLQQLAITGGRAPGS